MWGAFRAWSRGVALVTDKGVPVRLEELECPAEPVWRVQHFQRVRKGRERVNLWRCLFPGDEGDAAEGEEGSGYLAEGDVFAEAECAEDEESEGDAGVGADGADAHIPAGAVEVEETALEADDGESEEVVGPVELAELVGEGVGVASEQEKEGEGAGGGDEVDDGEDDEGMCRPGGAFGAGLVEQVGGDEEAEWPVGVSHDAMVWGLVGEASGDEGEGMVGEWEVAVGEAEALAVAL